MIGRRISHYDILEKLGEGGMGVVYKARDVHLGRIVALKFVSSTAAADPHVQERLLREARALASLNHPNITMVHDLAEEDDQTFIVMEFVEGMTLREVIDERSLSIDEVCRLGTQILEAVCAAHEKGVIHRDLKSANIMLDPADRVKVMDFGLAKLAEGTLITQTGTTLGTAAYMSPEQVRGEDPTAASDVYSVGVVLYELATGRLPFQHAHHLAMMYSVAHETPPRPRELNPEIPEALERVILRALEKNPVDRYASCAEAADDLRRAGERLPDGNVIPPTEEEIQIHGQVPSRGGRRTPRKWYLIAAPIVVLAAAASAFLLVFLEPHDPASLRQLAIVHADSAEWYIKEGNHERARAEVERALEIDSTFSDAWNTMAALSVRAGDFSAAIAQSRRAVELDPKNERAYYNLAYALEETNQLVEAERRYSDAIGLDSNFTAAYSALANLYISTERPELAERLLDRALANESEPEYVFLIYKGLGRAALVQGRLDDATLYLNQSLKMQPDYPETLRLLAQTLEESGRLDDSRAMLNRYLEVESDTSKQRDAMEDLQRITSP